MKIDSDPDFRLNFNTDFSRALTIGMERVAAFADLLDRINVFPVADGDTGRNLVISLSPLRRPDIPREALIHALLVTACGNSGNIAAGFLSGFLTANTVSELPEAAVSGRDRARTAIHNPKPGTMLTVFDALPEILLDLMPDNPNDRETVSCARHFHQRAIEIVSRLEDAVHGTRHVLPVLREAGVVDAGALGMFLLFEGFFYGLTGHTKDFTSVSTLFGNDLAISPAFKPGACSDFCVNAVVHAESGAVDNLKRAVQEKRSAITFSDKEAHSDKNAQIKIHAHTSDANAFKQTLAGFGNVVQWQADPAMPHVRPLDTGHTKRPIHIMTDAAGSLTRGDARDLGVTLLESYIAINGKCLPETAIQPDEMYAAMKNGVRVSTSQASVFERHQHYRAVLDQYDRVLYLCVGSVYTGNFETVMAWKQENDPENRMTVLDTTAASGRLALLVRTVVRFMDQDTNPKKQQSETQAEKQADEVIAFAKDNIHHCHEYIFLDRLCYLAAGGRLPKTGAFFGDMLRIKPVISPTARGAKKVGIARNNSEQLAFACKRLIESYNENSKQPIILEYSDNRAWVEDIVKDAIQTKAASADINIYPLSLTSGAHTGPGTWGIAFLSHAKAVSKIS